MKLPAITPTHPLARSSSLVAALLGSIALLFFWRMFPHIDLAISETFLLPYKCPASAPEGKFCAYFPLIEDPFMRGVRTAGQLFPLLIMALTAVWGLANLIFGYNPKIRFWQGPAVGLIAALLGPLLIVNLLLKSFKGRARPYQLEMFGRDKEFTLPGSISDQCDLNCSFPSGEAAAAAWLLFIVPFVPPSWRKQVLAFILFFIIFVSFLRVAFGRHFTSDVTMGIAITCVFLLAAFWLVARVPESWHRFRGTRGSKSQS